MCFATFVSLHFTARDYRHAAFPAWLPPRLYRFLPSPAHTSFLCPHSSVMTQYRIFSLLSIGYASPPLLRSRLTQGRSALPWNPWIFGQEDSHLFLATHSGILPAMRSTHPSGCASSCMPCSSTNLSVPKLRRRVSAPDIFGAGPLG